MSLSDECENAPNQPVIVDERIRQLIKSMFPFSKPVFVSPPMVTSYDDKAILWLNCAASSSSLSYRFIMGAYQVGQLLGIATMHKSNMVPVFADNKEEAKEIAQMRRN